MEVLELLLDQNDENPQVWYLLGWANFLHGEDYKENARFYLTKAKKVEMRTIFQKLKKCALYMYIQQ